MGWNAWLTDDHGGCTQGEWNYTHNTNGMIAAALEANTRLKVARQTGLLIGPGILGAAIGPTWWRLLDGKSGPEGAHLLFDIVAGLERDPDRFRDMNPPNGWGDYDSLLDVLRDMRDRVPEWPTTWSVHG
jgi:hypothetical protein